MQIETIPETRLTAAQDGEIAALLARCFTTDFGGRSFFQQRHHLRITARDPALVGHMALGLRAIRIGGHLTDIAGLADVATDPGHRGKGIAATLLPAAIAEAKAGPAQFLLLFGTAGLYAGAGFVVAHNPMTWIDLTGARMGAVTSQRAENLMVLPLRDKAWEADAPLDLLGNLF
ncbi:MAG: GNAT family N-acetyltransferase [Pseudomonadota bacterium]